MDIVAANIFGVGVPNMVLRCLIVLTIPHTLMSYPVFGTKRYGRSNHQAYIPLPVNLPMKQYYSDYQIPAYEEPDFDYNQYQYQPIVPYYGYYPVHRYYQNDRRPESYGYYGEEIDNPMDDLQEEIMQDESTPGYPYGQETWYEGSHNNNNNNNNNNAEANAAFLQNLIIAQMYQDAAASAVVNSGSSPRYAAAFPVMYSPIPTEGVNEKWHGPTNDELKLNEEAEEVKELESLRKNKNKNGKKKNKNKNKNRKNQELREQNEYEPEPQRYNYDGPVYEAQNEEPRGYVYGNLKTSYKRGMSQTDSQLAHDIQNELNERSRRKYPTLDDIYFSKYGQAPEPRQAELVTSKPLKYNGAKFSDRKNKIQIISTTQLPPSTTDKVFIGAQEGQKEVVLPRPATPARRPFANQISMRSSKPSVYDTLKQFLIMDRDGARFQNEPQRQLQKRFVTSEGQLVAELNGLKKQAV